MTQPRCPICQGALAEGQILTRCPHCGEELTKLLTPFQTGLLTDFGLGLFGGVTGLLVGIALVNYVPVFRSVFVLATMAMGGWLMAWGRGKMLFAPERFVWEQVWVTAFCVAVGVFFAVLLSLNGVACLACGILGGLVGYFLCQHAATQWRKGNGR